MMPRNVKLRPRMPARGSVLLLCLLLFSSCTFGGGQAETATATSTPTLDISSILPSPAPESLQSLLQTEQILLMTPHPLRDPYSLGQRLKLTSPDTIAQTRRTTPLKAHVGEEDAFWIRNLDTRRYTRIMARLVYVTPHVYMYVEDGQAVNLGALQSSANTFESKIYATTRAVFGSEWTPGIDDDVHITILNAIGLGSNVGGDFNAQDEYPTAIYPFSNQREMFYVSLDGPIPGSADYTSTLVHEFQYMIHWYQHPGDLRWSNAGMSVLAQHLNGYPVEGLVQSFLQTPDTQLNDWSNDSSMDSAHYGAGYLFMDYFATHYGGYGVLKELVRDPTALPDNFNHVLAKHGYADTFFDVLQKWYVANYVADITLDNGAYGYSDSSLPGLTPQHSVTNYPISENDTVHQYAAEYYDLHAPLHHGTLTIRLTGSPLIRIINNVPYAATNEWWGNRYDAMDSTLTRTFDLTQVKGKQATLQFATWYELERDSDYAFVEASTDGADWTTLAGRFTTKSNPTGNNWGNGYTGVSGGGAAPQWVQEHIDLSPYIGKKIELRFEEVTNEAVNLQGFAIDSIRIPEIHFQDALTSDNGWISHGFIRSNNVLPEHFNVQALLYHGTQFSLSSMPVDLATGQGTLTIPSFGTNVTRVVLIVSAYAAETTLLAHYQLDLQVK